MACCGEYDSEQQEEFWPTYAENCMLDSDCQLVRVALKFGSVMNGPHDRKHRSNRVKSLAARLLMTSALMLASGCERDECSVLSRQVRAGDVFNVSGHGHDFSPFCDAGFEAGQAHARWVAEAWGEPPASFDYQLFESRDDACWPCRSGTVGCAWATHLAATDIPHRHEIAHSVRGLPCPRLLEEGWAELYGAHFTNGVYWPPMTDDLREAADASGLTFLPHKFYPLAVKFVAFLLETRGLDGLKALCEQKIDSAESLDSALTKVFGQSLDDVSAEFDNYPPWTLGQLRQDQACEGTAITSAPGTWSMNLECGAPGVEGREDGPLILHHLVDLPEPGEYVFSFDTSVNFFVTLQLRNCTSEGLASIYHERRFVYGYGTPKNVVFSDLPAGVYVFRLELQDATEPLALEMAVTTWP